MEILQSEKYKYIFFNNNIIMFQKKDEIKIVESEIKTISSNTNNTWQPDRKGEELTKNTRQGKIAEDMFVDFITFAQPNKKINFLPYDYFRDDNFEKHAPIDGLIYEKNNTHLSAGIKMILDDVTAIDYGGISIKTRNYLSTNRLYTVEIKSSKIPERDLENIDLSKFNNSKQQRQIINALRKRDYFTYPRYTRSLGENIHNFKQYCEYVKATKEEFVGLQDDELKSAIISREIETKCDIYTRIFIDAENSDSLIGYLSGYALAKDFFTNPKIINMPRKGKSEKALYFVFPIRKARFLSKIFVDERLWD